MAIVQHTNVNADETNSVTFSFVSTPTTNNLLLFVAVLTNAGGETILSPATVTEIDNDNGSNTPTIAAAYRVVNSTLNSFLFKSVSADHIGYEWEVIGFEISGLATSSLIDGHILSLGTNVSTKTSGTVTPSASGKYVFAYCSGPVTSGSFSSLVTSPSVTLTVDGADYTGTNNNVSARAGFGGPYNSVSAIDTVATYSASQSSLFAGLVLLTPAPAVQVPFQPNYQRAPILAQ